MKLTPLVLLLQVLAAPDPAQMERAPDLGYAPLEQSLALPAGMTLGAPSSVAMTTDGHLLIFNRGDYPLIEVGSDGRFIRSFGEGRFKRPHGMRVDAEGNIWTTDVDAHTVTKMTRDGMVLLVLDSRVVNQPTDVAIGPGGDIFVTQGHGAADPRVLKFDRTGTLKTTWGGKGTGPGQFDLAHSIVIDGKGLVYVADRQNRRVQIFDGNGTFVREWKFAGLPCGLHVSASGELYLVTGFAGQILRLDTNGKAIGATGQPGKGLGEFGEAHYLTIGPRGEIYVADTVNARLHTFVKK